VQALKVRLQNDLIKVDSVSQEYMSVNDLKHYKIPSLQVGCFKV